MEVELNTDSIIFLFFFFNHMHSYGGIRNSLFLLYFFVYGFDNSSPKKPSFSLFGKNRKNEISNKAKEK